MADPTSSNRPRRQVVLIVIDGWGIAPAGPANAVTLAGTPTMDRLWSECPHTSVAASGEDVGLPAGQIGNSEVGHLNIGAGYLVLQDLPRIDKEIESGDFFENAALVGAVEHVKAGREQGGHKGDGPRPALHLMGLYSDGGVHSSGAHCLALIDLARKLGLDEVFVHVFLDGRDVPPRSALDDLTRLDDALQSRPGGRVATVIGRYYAMDRDTRWDRTGAAYAALVAGEGERADSAPAAVHASYEQDTSDEFVKPTVVGDPSEGRITAGDAVVFFNFRADRARQLTEAFVAPEFDGFERGERLDPLHVVTFSEYASDMPVSAVAFPNTLVETPLARVIADAGLRQLHVAETEKYAHVTYFLNGGHEKVYAAEDRELVPSPKIATYDLEPAMNAAGVTAKAIEGICAGYDFVVLNYANPDMVGHTGVLDAAVVAVEIVDRGIGEIVAAAEERDAVVIVTADHGNAEEMVDPETGQPKTAHTTNPVPLIVVGAPEVTSLRGGGKLSDVAPTTLDLLGLEAPAEMTAQSLVVR